MTEIKNLSSVIGGPGANGVDGQPGQLKTNLV